MVIILEAALSEPPSSVHCFRDVTLYASIFRRKEILVACDRDMIDNYWNWLKSFGAMDFVKDIIPEGVEDGYTIGTKNSNLTIPLLDETYLSKVITTLRKI